MGFLLLEGGAELSGRVDEADKRALALAGCKAAPVDVIPATDAHDNNQYSSSSLSISNDLSSYNRSVK
jgi:hypothetical protein